ncbi:MAG: hypothetical protein ABSG80_03940 [Verrucomicrobiota bacterium]|jgi:hypothetical protein
MKLKILLLVAGVVAIGSSIIVLLLPLRPHQLKFPPAENQLPTALSNYSKTFKLNTSPPIWAQPTNGNSTH